MPTSSTPAPAAATQSRLTPDQVEHFKDQGYLIVDQPIFSGDKFQRLAKHFDVMLEQWVQDPLMRSPEHMDVPHFHDPALFEWLFDEEILSLVEPILGPDIALFSSHFICKPAGTGKRVPWHEDSGYWKGRLDPMEVVTVWLAIDPSTPSNGCMRVIPSSHRTGKCGFSDYESVDDEKSNVFVLEIKNTDMDESQAVDCILKPNQASLHDSRLIHGSNANTGDVRRCGYTMRFISTRTRFKEDVRSDGFHIYLAKGKDHAGNKYGDPTKVNQAWFDAHPNGFPAGH